MEVINFCKQYLSIYDPQLLQKLASVSEIRLFKKGEYLIRQGEEQQTCHLLVKGICRAFFVDIDGKDITDCLVVRSGFPLAATSSLIGKAPVALQVLVDSEIFCISIASFKELMQEFNQISQIYQNFLLGSSEFHRQMKIMNYQCTAMQRYQWFLKNYPGVLERIRHKYVASFLNMTPVTLSRLINSSNEKIEKVTLFNFDVGQS